LEIITLVYNNSKAWSVQLGQRLDGDRVLAAMSATTTSAIAVGLQNPKLYDQLDAYVPPPRRTLDQLRAAGYVVKPNKKDPFTEDQLARITEAQEQ
jgi:hypothetical protein